MLDEFNPGTLPDGVSKKDFENQQNQAYGSHHWYPPLRRWTMESEFVELKDEWIDRFSRGDDGDESPFPEELVGKVEDLIRRGFTFFKTTHASAHSSKPLACWADFLDQVQNPRVIMSFRNHRCRYLMFRKWNPSMDLEVRVYVYKSKIRLVDVYRDNQKRIRDEKQSEFDQIEKFVMGEIVPALSHLYSDFTVDVHWDNEKQTFGVVEINSPLYLKCGTYHIDYEFSKRQIHEAESSIRLFLDLTHLEAIL